MPEANNYGDHSLGYVVVKESVEGKEMIKREVEKYPAKKPLFFWTLL